jgi:hypothetical protein
MRHRRLAETEYRKVRKEASKDAMKMAEERQAVLASVFKEQMEQVSNGFWWVLVGCTL